MTVSISTLYYPASGAATFSNPNVNTTFTIAMQGIVTGNNYRNSVIKTSLGLPVNNNYANPTLSLGSGESVVVTAGQLIWIISDQPLLVTVTPDPTPVNLTPGTSTQYGNVFVFTGSYLTTGITVANPPNVLTPVVANIKMALIS